jgi:hypothetical protein
MKKIKFLVACMMCSLFVSAQTTNYFTITLHKNILLGACNLSQDTQNVVYMHSGAGYKGITSLWDCVVGNWGKKDGVGRMTTIDDTTYMSCIDISKTASNYYSNTATANVDSGIMPIGDTIHNIGCVFRDPGPFPFNSQGQPVLNVNLKGASDDNCSDVWILDLPSGSPSVVEQFDGSTPVNSVTVAFVASCPTATGVHDISDQLINDIIVSPNPFTDKINIQFNMVPDFTKVKAQVYDVMGKKVADFSPGITGGYNYFSWDGSGAGDIALPAGTYLLKVTNGTQILTKKLVKQ